MAKIMYKAWRPGSEAAQIVALAEGICEDYRQQGYDLTLRQLYYQFVARDLLANNQKSYDRLGVVINQARLAGMLDWDYIVDRTRNLESLAHWNSPADILSAVASQYAVDKWRGQPHRVEVWVEKEALAGIVGQASSGQDVAWFSCRGYTSQSELWGAGQRLLKYIQAGQSVTVLHLGDHDPSGMDMTRDITDRLRLFIYTDFYRERADELDPKYEAIEAAMADRCGGRTALTVKRIALNWDQVQQYDPPPNPAKLSDSRAAKYIDEYGTESWELDALDPSVLDDLITEEIDHLRDPGAWAEREGEQATAKAQLATLTRRWDDVVALIGADDA